MINFKKATALILSGIMAFSFASCSKKEKSEEKLHARNAEEINQKYDEVINSINSDAKNADSGNPFENLSFNSEAFSSFDYSLYPPSDEYATHSLDKNTFGKVNLGGTYFNSIAPGNAVYHEAESFKTAKDLTILNTADEFISAYCIENGKAVYKPAGSNEYIALSNGSFTGTLTAVYVSKGDGKFALLGEEETRKFLKIRDENSNGMYFDPKLINDAFSDFQSVASLDISVNDINQIYEFSICRFEATDESDVSH